MHRTEDPKKRSTRDLLDSSDCDSHESIGSPNLTRQASGSSCSSSSSSKMHTMEIEQSKGNDLVSSILMFPVIVILNVISSLTETVKHGFEEFVYECTPNFSKSGEGMSKMWKVWSFFSLPCHTIFDFRFKPYK